MSEADDLFVRHKDRFQFSPTEWPDLKRWAHCGPRDLHPFVDPNLARHFGALRREIARLHEEIRKLRDEMRALKVSRCLEERDNKNTVPEVTHADDLAQGQEDDTDRVGEPPVRRRGRPPKRRE